MKLSFTPIFFVAICFIACSCRTPVNLLKKEVVIDTLHLVLDTRPVYSASFKDSMIKKMEKFVGAYNTESHPFKLAFHQETGTYPAAITIKFNKIKFISKNHSIVASGITAAGLGTATFLIATGFVIPFGWIYIPSAKCVISPEFNAHMSDLTRHQKIMLSTPGMFRTASKQQSILSRKLVKYVVEMVLNIELQYKNINNRQ